MNTSKKNYIGSDKKTIKIMDENGKIQNWEYSEIDTLFNDLVSKNGYVFSFWRDELESALNVEYGGIKETIFLNNWHKRKARYEFREHIKACYGRNIGFNKIKLERTFKQDIINEHFENCEHCGTNPNEHNLLIKYYDGSIIVECEKSLFRIGKLYE